MSIKTACVELTGGDYYYSDSLAVNKRYVDNLIGDINSVLATIVDGVE